MVWEPFLYKFNIPADCHYKEQSLPLEEYQEALKAITDESNEMELMQFFKKCKDPGLGFLYLGSRDEIDYGVRVVGVKYWPYLTELDTDEPFFLHLPKTQDAEAKDKDISYSDFTIRAFFVNDIKSVGALLERGDPDGHNVSTETSQIHDEKELLKVSFFLQNTTTEARVRVAESLSKTPDIRRAIEIGGLETYSAKQGWSTTRFVVVKALDKNEFWIIAIPRFYDPEYVLDDEELEAAEPQLRTYPLDGFQEPISCARIKANEESLQYDEEMQQENPRRTLMTKDFSIDQIHSGGFVLLSGVPVD
ncbi:MAG: hypothetical protein M1821_009897 [Bathelium mastoideum]|nr:MAG: hypothetical protein M1821_009897 [Bathelium mastoideum]